MLVFGAVERNILFNIGGWEISNFIFTMWGVMAFLIIMAIIGTAKLERIPGRFQCLVELIYESLIDFLSGMMGKEGARRYFPILGTFFMLILCCNWSSLLPGAGGFRSFIPPTTTWSVTAALAVTVFFITQIAGFKEHGIGYLKHFIEPFVFFLPLNIIEELVRPLSLSLRLYGNMFGEKMTVMVIAGLAPFLVPVPLMFLGMLLGFVQALVFTLLAAVYISSAVSSQH